MLKVKPFQFGGSCEGCGRRGQHTRAVEVTTDEHEAWFCAGCAKRLARRLLSALGEADVKVKTGMHYRHRAWVKKPNAITLAVRS